MSYGNYHSGPSQDDFEQTVQEFERAQVKLEDRLERVEEQLQRRKEPSINPRAFVSVQDHNKLCDDVDELRTALHSMGRLMRALTRSIEEIALA